MSTVGGVEVRLLGQLEAVADDGSAIADPGGEVALVGCDPGAAPR